MTDTQGNSITNLNGWVMLKLAAEKHSRKVGYLANDILRVERTRHKHLHRLSNSYGFNYEIISKAKRFTKVLLCDEFGQYMIPNEYILEHGGFLHFKTQGFEKQIFLKLEEINKFKL